MNHYLCCIRTKHKIIIKIPGAMKKTTILLSITIALICSIGFGIYSHCYSSRPSISSKNDKAIPNDSDKDQDAIIQYNILYKSKSRFQFENIEFEDTKLIPFLLNKKDKEIEDFVYPKTYSELGSFKRKERMPTDIFKVFANFDIVNGWSEYMKEFYPSKEEMIKNIIEGYSLYYCGQVKLSQTFDSFLFMTTFGKDRDSSWVDYYINRDVYLVNMSENKITSIALLFYYYGGGDDGVSMGAYTYKDKHNNFYRHSKTLSSDVIIPDEVKKAEGINDDDETIFKFKFGKTGHIVVL